jgi:hypothetical protein
MKWAAIVGLAMAFGPGAVGNTVYTYEYEGSLFQSQYIAGPVYNTQEGIIVSLSLSSPLPVNHPLDDEIDDVLAFQIDLVDYGESKIVYSTDDYTILALETDFEGEITAWMIDSPEDYQVSLTYLSTSSYGDPVDSQDYAGMFDSGGDPVAHGYNLNEPGTWTSLTESSAPEPSGFLLMVAGVGALALLRRRIRRGNARLEVSRA